MAQPRRALPLRHMRHLNTSAIFVLSLGSLSGATILMVVARATINRSPWPHAPLGAGLKRLQGTAPDAMSVRFWCITTVSVPARPLTVSPDAGALATASVDPRRLRDPVSCGCSRRERITNALLTVFAGRGTRHSTSSRHPFRTFLFGCGSESNDQVFQYAGSRTTTHTPLAGIRVDTCLIAT